jgi:DNA primase
LYGLHLTRDEIRRQGFAILVEGYLDLIVPYQFGVKNVVASLGTALTPEQVKLIGRFARKVVVNYDGDRAGVQAAKRAIETLLAEDLEVKVLVLPDNADPDDFIRKHGVNEYQQRRGTARPHIQFVIDEAVRDRNLHRPADKAAAVEETLPFVRAVRSRIQRREYFDIAMDALRIPPDGRRELWQRTRSDAIVSNRSVQQLVTTQMKTLPAEEQLLELLLGNEDVRAIILARVKDAGYEELATAAIFRALFEVSEKKGEITFDTLSEHLTDDPKALELLPRLMMKERIESFDEALAKAEKCLNTIEMVRLDSDLEELMARIGEAERAGEAELSLELQHKHLEKRKQKDALDALLPRGHQPSVA